MKRRLRLPARAGAGVAALALALALPLGLASSPASAGADEGRAKAQGCAACHGADGNSALAGVPSLAAQPKQFIVSALFQFREGKRVNPVMTPLAANLTNADLNDLAAHFSALPAAQPAATPTAAVQDEGRRLTVQNNCVACHAVNLMGQQHIPRVAGQRADYLREQLRAFKATTRADLDGTMTSAAQALSAADIDTLADYLAALPATR